VDGARDVYGEDELRFGNKNARIAPSVLLRDIAGGRAVERRTRERLYAEDVFESFSKDRREGARFNYGEIDFSRRWMFLERVQYFRSRQFRSFPRGTVNAAIIIITNSAAFGTILKNNNKSSKTETS